MYKIHLERAVQKDLRGFERKLQDQLLKAFKTIAADLFSGEPLKGGLSVYRSLHISYQGKQYRIAYVIYQKLQTVVVIMIGPREKFYERLKAKVSKR